MCSPASQIDWKVYLQGEQQPGTKQILALLLLPARTLPACLPQAAGEQGHVRQQHVNYRCMLNYFQQMFWPKLCFF